MLRNDHICTRGAKSGCVMADDAMPVPAQVNIAFYRIGILLPCQIKSRQGVFRRRAGSAPVGNYDRNTHNICNPFFERKLLPELSDSCYQGDTTARKT